MLFSLLAAAAPRSPDGGTAAALLTLIILALIWFGARALARSLRARKTESTVHGDFTGYALHALVNAAKIDGRSSDTEKRAIVFAMREIDGAAFEAVKVEAAFAQAGLSKDELVAYLADRAAAFTRDQKAALLKGLLSVFVSDGAFDETEHAALVDYTAAIGFDRQSAPHMLRSLMHGAIT